MSSRRVLNPPGLHPATGYSHIVMAPEVGLAFLSGQVPLDRDFALVGGNDLGEQTKAAMRNIKVALDAIGASWEHVCRRTIYTVHPTELETITAAIEEVQGPVDHPAETIIGVTGLALEGLLIEIETTVLLPK
ncbi:Enamine/imine deaminase [Kocuria rosea]|jgi:enamine deaminase RidA (YjgF/YER057c/UK114 family)|nr:RidA family protein [Kocuria rosea]VEH41097.1 Enamine/imine deaminase [Kocuria rosea]